MEGLHTIQQLIRRNDLITKVDLSDFYMHFLIGKTDRRPDDVSDLLGTDVFPHIRDLEDQQYFKKLDIATAEAEGLS